MLAWTQGPQTHEGYTWSISDGAVHAADAGFSVLGQRVGRAATPTNLHHYFVAGGGRRLWFIDEPALRCFVDEVFAPQLNLGDRHQAIVVGLMWAHELAYSYDRPSGPVPLPPEFGGIASEVRGRLLEKDPKHVAASAPIVLAAAKAAWSELRARSVADRPFPILQ